MLIKCYECSAEVSDLAVTCPHCGAPLGKNASSLLKYKEFVDDVFSRLSKSRSEYGSDALDKILSIPATFEKMEGSLRDVKIANVIHSALFVGSSNSYAKLDYGRFFWEKCGQDRLVITEVVQEQIARFLLCHADLVKANPASCRDLLIDTMVSPGWWESGFHSRVTAHNQGVREFMVDFRENQKAPVRVQDKALLFCDQQVIAMQDRYVSEIVELYRKNSHNCVRCHAHISNPGAYYFTVKLQCYAHVECGQVDFYVDVPRCKACAESDNRESSLLESKESELQQEINALAEACKKKTIFGNNNSRKAQIEVLRDQRDSIWSQRYHLRDVYSNYVVTEAIKQRFHYDPSFDAIRDGWSATDIHKDYRLGTYLWDSEELM